MKAIAWSPHHHGLLASGGGTADRYIRFTIHLESQALIDSKSFQISKVYFPPQVLEYFDGSANAIGRHWQPGGTLCAVHPSPLSPVSHPGVQLGLVETRK